ncbi:hydrogenase maturation nickel metallochaperone HypA [Arthrobacter sp. NPDC058130]|uniref:hydrogenase maturation nickel metallochaperone HypA/HybF n=1 Tax=Arthrobacter sp. NPDC058130 TaxID=3346353 RepID=UPI0036E7D72F
MHELAITQGLVEAVLNRTGDRHVTGVNLRIGPLSGVLPDAVRFCFEVVSADTPLAGAALTIDESEGRARCRSCHDEFVLEDMFLLCPCGSADVEIVSGRELLVTSVEVA